MALREWIWLGSVVCFGACQWDPGVTPASVEGVAVVDTDHDSDTDDTPSDTDEDTPSDTDEDTPSDTDEDTPSDTDEDTPSDTGDDVDTNDTGPTDDGLTIAEAVGEEGGADCGGCASAPAGGAGLLAMFTLIGMLRRRD